MTGAAYRVSIIVSELTEDGDTDVFATWETDPDLKTATENAMLTLSQYSYYIQED